MSDAPMRRSATFTVEASTSSAVEEERDAGADVQHLNVIHMFTELAIAAVDTEKMDAGGHAVPAILMQLDKTLCGVMGPREPTIDNIRDAVLKIVSTAFIPGTAGCQRRSQGHRASTGSTAFNELTGDGVGTGSIATAFGELRCAKAPLIDTMCETRRSQSWWRARTRASTRPRCESTWRRAWLTSGSR